VAELAATSTIQEDPLQLYRRIMHLSFYNEKRIPFVPRTFRLSKSLVVRVPSRPAINTQQPFGISKLADWEMGCEKVSWFSK